MDANGNDPTAHGMVLAMLVDREGKPARGGPGPVKAHLYVTNDEIVLVRLARIPEMLNRISMLLLVVPVAAVIANVFQWKSFKVLWISAILLAIYSIVLPIRRRAFEPKPLSAAGLGEARADGRVVIHVPARDVQRAVPPEPPRTGFRKPARFELPDGALEVYLSQEQFHSVASAIGH